MMNTTSEPSSAQSINLASIELGVTLSSVLLGIVLVQTYKYFQASFRRDSTLLKCVIGSLCLMQIIHSVFLWIYLYDKTVTNFGIGDADNDTVAIHWSLRASLPLTAMITLLVQGFFAHRVYVISSVWYYPAVAVPALLIRLGLGIARGVVASSSSLALFIKDFKWLIVSASTLGAVIDVSNTLALCILMGKNYNPMLRSRRVSDKVMVWTIETGLITSIYSVIEVILILCMDNLLWMFFFFQAAKLYSNALLSFLNGRISLRSAQEANHIVPGSLGSRGITNEPNNIEVHIEMGRETRSERTRTDTPARVSGPKLKGSGDTLSSVEMAL